jgi:UDP-GlcNAc:undecaprenyl-phosphate GlcNAc-1-phosphate transferase
MIFSLTFIISLLFVVFAIPSIIAVSFRKRLFDDPSESRKVHDRVVPNFGGVAIFTAMLFSCSLLIPSYLLMTGLKDDVVGLSPAIKFLAQLVSALITVVVANIRIENMHGMFGAHELPYVGSVILTVFFIVGIVNAFNLIDGIDGLAGTLGVIFSLIFAFLFFKAGVMGWSYIALSLTGALIGFLFFNVTPAQIFMGDSGSLLLGFVAALLSLKFLQVSSTDIVMFGPFYITSGAGLVIAVLIIPIFDTLRVLILRILKNTSPFRADNNHLHHRLLFLGLSHVQATLVLAVANVLFVVMALSLQQLGNTQLIGLIVVSILMLNGALSLYIEHYKKTALLSSTTFASKTRDDRDELASGKANFGEEVLKKISKN